MTIEVRPIAEDDDTEVTGFVAALAVGFNHRMRDDEVELRRGGFTPGRQHVAIDGAAVVGTARAFATPLTLPGLATVDVAAVTNVAVLPTHRRRGVLRSMMAAQLDDAAERDEPIAILIAAEAPIYGRYGYGPATQRATLKLNTGKARFTAPPARQADLRVVDNAEMRKVGPGIYDRYREAQPGAIGRTERWWDFRAGVLRATDDDSPDKQFHVVCGDDGYATYKIDDDWQPGFLPNGKVPVIDFVAATDDAYAALWDYLLRLDLVVEVEVSERPAVEPLPYLLTDPRRAVVTELSDFVWVRLLDVARALASRTYATHDRLVLEVVDEFRPASGGQFVLDTTGDVAVCEPAAAGAEPDLVLHTRELGAAYLGGTPLDLAARAGRVDERTPAAVRRFDTLFHTTPAPHCNTWF